MRHSLRKGGENLIKKSFPGIAIASFQLTGLKKIAKVEESWNKCQNVTKCRTKAAFTWLLKFSIRMKLRVRLEQIKQAFFVFF